MSGPKVNTFCSSPPNEFLVIDPPVPPPVPPDPLVKTMSDVDDNDDDIDDVDDDVAIDPPISDDVEYVSLNAVDFTNASFAWSNPSTSTEVQHFPYRDLAHGPFDSMVEAVEATLIQLNIATNPEDKPL